MQDILTAMSAAVNALPAGSEEDDSPSCQGSNIAHTTDAERGEANNDGHDSNGVVDKENEDEHGGRLHPIQINSVKTRIRDASAEECQLWRRLQKNSTEAEQMSQLKDECRRVLDELRDDGNVPVGDISTMQEKIFKQVKNIHQIYEIPKLQEKVGEIRTKSAGTYAAVRRIEQSMGKYHGESRKSTVQHHKDNTVAELEEQEAELEAEVESLRKLEAESIEEKSKLERRIETLEAECKDGKENDTKIKQLNHTQQELRQSIDAAEERLTRQHNYAQDLFSIIRKLRKEKAYNNALCQGEHAKRQKTEEGGNLEPRYTYNRIKTRKLMEEQGELRKEQEKLNKKLHGLKEQAEREEAKSKEALEVERSEETRNIQTKLNAIKAQKKASLEQSQKYRSNRVFYGRLQQRLIQTAMSNGSLVALILHCLHQAGGETTLDELNKDVLRTAEEHKLSKEIQDRVADRKELTRAIYDMCNNSLLTKDASTGRVTALT
eukprot:gb/GECG01005853.1/.p1 GENE.gb/GECG01005853.1/~~gb/GECG01005853.1/.p1  ORF type:complete len:492 (+),score=97.15 gb/GECG01005853.1/:1-1476(+)